MVFSSYKYVEQKALLLEAKGYKAPTIAMLLCERCSQVGVVGQGRRAIRRDCPGAPSWLAWSLVCATRAGGPFDRRLATDFKLEQTREIRQLNKALRWLEE